MGPKVKEDRYYRGQVQDQGLKIKNPQGQIKGLVRKKQVLVEPKPTQPG